MSPRAWCGCAAVAGATLTLIAPESVAPQVLEYTAGTSTLLRAHGASLDVHGATYRARFGFGLEGADRTPRIGASFEAPFRGLTWRLGDQTIPLALPTDVFGASYYFLGRGDGCRAGDQPESFLPLWRRDVPWSGDPVLPGG